MRVTLANGWATGNAYVNSAYGKTVDVRSNAGGLVIPLPLTRLVDVSSVRAVPWVLTHGMRDKNLIPPVADMESRMVVRWDTGSGVGDAIDVRLGRGNQVVIFASVLTVDVYNPGTSLYLPNTVNEAYAFVAPAQDAVPPNGPGCFIDATRVGNIPVSTYQPGNIAIPRYCVALRATADFGNTDDTSDDFLIVRQFYPLAAGVTVQQDSAGGINKGYPWIPVHPTSSHCRVRNNNAIVQADNCYVLFQVRP
jgi:hypothetical protein